MADVFVPEETEQQSITCLSLCGKNSSPSLLPSLVLCSLGTFPPSNLIHLQRNLPHLNPHHPASPHSSPFRLYELDVLRLLCAAIRRFKSQVQTAHTSSIHPPPHRPCPHQGERKVVVISGPLRCNDRSCAASTECHVLFWKESGARARGRQRLRRHPQQRGDVKASICTQLVQESVIKLSVKLKKERSPKTLANSTVTQR